MGQLLISKSIQPRMPRGHWRAEDAEDRCESLHRRVAGSGGLFWGGPHECFGTDLAIGPEACKAKRREGSPEQTRICVLFAEEASAPGRTSEHHCPQCALLPFLALRMDV